MQRAHCRSTRCGRPCRFLSSVLRMEERRLRHRNRGVSTGSLSDNWMLQCSSCDGYIYYTTACCQCIAVLSVRSVMIMCYHASILMYATVHVHIDHNMRPLHASCPRRHDIVLGHITLQPIYRNMICRQYQLMASAVTVSKPNAHGSCK